MMNEPMKKRRSSYDRFELPPGAMTIVKKGNGKPIKLATREELLAEKKGRERQES